MGHETPGSGTVTGRGRWRVCSRPEVRTQRGPDPRSPVDHQRSPRAFSDGSRVVQPTVSTHTSLPDLAYLGTGGGLTRGPRQTPWDPSGLVLLSQSGTDRSDVRSLSAETVGAGVFLTSETRRYQKDYPPVGTGSGPVHGRKEAGGVGSVRRNVRSPP